MSDKILSTVVCRYDFVNIYMSVSIYIYIYIYIIYIYI